MGALCSTKWEAKGPHVVNGDSKSYCLRKAKKEF